jgi:uncharacterized protein YciI
MKSHGERMSLRLFAALTAGAFVLSAEHLPAQSPSPAPSASAGAKQTPIEFDKFMFVLLVRPPNAPDFPKEELTKMQEGHMANMGRLHKEGKLLKAGPVEDYSGRNARGIFILTTESQEEAREWMKDDPLINAGRLVPEMMKWYVEKGELK